MDPSVFAGTALQLSSTTRTSWPGIATVESPEAYRIAGNRPPGLGLPPMVDHRHLQHVLRAFHGVRVGALSGKEQRAEFP